MSEKIIENKLQAHEYIYNASTGVVPLDEAVMEQAKAFFTNEELFSMVLTPPYDVGKCFSILTKDSEVSCTCNNPH